MSTVKKYLTNPGVFTYIANLLINFHVSTKDVDAWHGFEGDDFSRIRETVFIAAIDNLLATPMDEFPGFDHFGLEFNGWKIYVGKTALTDRTELYVHLKENGFKVVSLTSLIKSL